MIAEAFGVGYGVDFDDLAAGDLELEPGSEYRFRVEQREQGLEGAVPRSCKEGVDNFPLAGGIGILNRTFPLYPAPGPPGELSRRRLVGAGPLPLGWPGRRRRCRC